MLRPSDEDRQRDLNEANRYREFLPDKNHDPEHQTQARRARAEQKYWGEQRELIVRAWG